MQNFDNKLNLRQNTICSVTNFTQNPENFTPFRMVCIGLWKVGAKRPLKGVRKRDGQTDKQTNKQTYGHFDLEKASAQRADDLQRPKVKKKIDF